MAGVLFATYNLASSNLGWSAVSAAEISWPGSSKRQAFCSDIWSISSLESLGLYWAVGICCLESWITSKILAHRKKGKRKGKMGYLEKPAVNFLKGFSWRLLLMQISLQCTVQCPIVKFELLLRCSNSMKVWKCVQTYLRKWMSNISSVTEVNFRIEGFVIRKNSARNRCQSEALEREEKHFCLLLSASIG